LRFWQPLNRRRPRLFYTKTSVTITSRYHLDFNHGGIVANKHLKAGQTSETLRFLSDQK
jgi:hypothetical protein